MAPMSQTRQKSPQHKPRMPHRIQNHCVVITQNAPFTSSSDKEDALPCYIAAFKHLVMIRRIRRNFNRTARSVSRPARLAVAQSSEGMDGDQAQEDCGNYERVITSYLVNHAHLLEKEMSRKDNLSRLPQDRSPSSVWYNSSVPQNISGDDLDIK